MVCVPAFVPGLDFECVKDLIADVRSGSISVVTAQKALWVAGNALSFFVKPEVPFGDVDKPLEQICDEIEADLAFKATDVSKIDPATIMLIVQLVMKVLQLWVKK